MSIKEQAYKEEFISFEEQLKQIRKDLDQAKEQCEECCKAANKKKVWLCGCYGSIVLATLEETKQKLRDIRKLLELN